MNNEHPDDNYDYRNESDASHACHKPVELPQERATSNEAGLDACAALRAAIDIKPAEPKWIDTTDIESELTRVER